MSVFPSRLAEMRNKNGYSQQDLANKLGTARVTVAAYETGNRSPTLTNLIALSWIFQCSIDYLIGNNIKFVDLPSFTSNTKLKVFVEDLAIATNSDIDKITEIWEIIKTPSRY